MDCLKDIKIRQDKEIEGLKKTISERDTKIDKIREEREDC
jgi:hypothetical protein